MGQPVFFFQKRPGYKTKPFTLIKFRTMSNHYDKDGNLHEDHERITPLGSFLRSTSLDELPSLLNILFGEMSFVGPRPLLMEYLPLYNPNQLKRHDVLPGFTGLAQIKGRNKISWSEKFNLDLKYIENISLFSDLSIIFITVFKVISREGINASTKTTMPPFRG